MKQAFLGIDVSKGYADFLLLNEHKKVLEPTFQLQDNPQGHQQLKALIEQWFVQGIEQLFCGMESTGGYENNWYRLLKNQHREGKVQTARLNAKAVKALSEALLRRTLTDGVSAENIARYLASFPEKVDYAAPQHPLGEGCCKEGRQQLNYIHMLQKQKVQLTNQLEKLLYQCFPQLMVYQRHGQPLWLLQLLCLYPCAQAVCKAGISRLSKTRGISRDKAQALVGKAETSDVSISPQLQHLIKVTAAEILHKQQLIEAEKTYLLKAYKEDERVKLLDSIPGIGVESAVSLLLEIEAIQRFASAKKLVAYFGLHPTYRQSGDGLWGKHLSKQGRSAVRATLYMPALSAVRSHPLFKGLYARFRASGMNHLQAMGVVMHKLLRIIYGVLKHKKPFEEPKEENNQSEPEQENGQPKPNEAAKQSLQHKQRFQAASLQAPLSGRTAKKLKQHLGELKKQEAAQAS